MIRRFLRRGLAALPAVAAIWLASCSGRPPSVHIDPALATLVPPDAVMLAGVRVDKLRETPLWRKHAERLELPLLDQTGQAIEVDLRRNLWEVLAVATGRHAVALARGKFGESGLEPRISARARRMPYKGYTVLATGDSALVFLNTSTAIAGRPEAVMWMLDQRGKSSGPPAALSALLRDLPPASQVWVAALGGSSLASAPGNAANFARALSFAEHVTASAVVDSAVKLRAEALGRTVEDAASLHDAVKALLALAQLGSRDPARNRLLDSVQLERRERRVTLQLTVPDEQVGALLK